MARYFTADLHLGHRNIIDYSSRPFRDVEQMDTALVERWNATVTPEDEVIVLGDFAMGRIDETLPIAGVLNGRKLLLAGNHDRCWLGHKKGVESATDLYLAAGFDEIWQGTIDLAVGGMGVLACHVPYRGDSQDHDRYLSHRPADAGAWLLHGHVHERWKVRDRMINVGVAVWTSPGCGTRARRAHHSTRRHLTLLSFPSFFGQSATVAATRCRGRAYSSAPAWSRETTVS